MPITRAQRIKAVHDQEEALKQARDDFVKKLLNVEEKHPDIRKFTFQRFLGKGSFGAVYKALNSEGEVVAVKIQEKEKLSESGAISALNEKIYLRGCDSLFVAKMNGTWRSALYLALVIEYAPYGDLKRLIKEGPAPENKIKHYVAQIVCALEYLHATNLIFCDLKPENCLIYEQGRLKLGDFGLTIFGSDRFFGLQGTPAYMAPEIYLLSIFTEAVDWWALGVTVHKLLLNTYPFLKKNETREEMYKRFKEPVEGLAEAEISDEARDLIEQLFILAPEKRLGVNIAGLERLKKHAWFTDIDFAWVRSAQYFNPEFDLTEIEGEYCDADLFHHDAPREQDPKDHFFKEY